MSVATQQHAEIIEPGHDALQFNAVHQEDRERRFTFANVIEKSVLEILGSIRGHCRRSFFWSTLRLFSTGVRRWRPWTAHYRSGRWH
jgi:hypothetical protein